MSRKKIIVRLQDGSKTTLAPGDFVNLTKWFGDIWAEVEIVWDSNAYVMCYNGKSHYEFVYNKQLIFGHKIACIRQVHHKNDPWQPKKARIVHCKEGTHGESKNFQQHSILGKWPSQRFNTQGI